jgi:hypothetical protein
MSVVDTKLEILNSLSKEEREATLKILKEYASDGSSPLLEKLKYIDFDEIPVDIHTFLHNKIYLGNALYDAEGRFTLFPYWEKTLEDIFPDNISTKYNNIVFTGAIGLGKSTIAVICLLYMLYRLLCLKDPYIYYGMQPTDKLTISLMNITLENAKGVALDKMNQMILTSEWFLKHGEMGGATNLIYRPEKHIEVITASSNNQIIGRAIFCNFTDEVNFSLVSNPEKQKQKMMKLITQIDARMKSRFLRGTYLPTLNILASSKDTEQSFLEAYINGKKETESKNTLIVDEPQWVVDKRKDSPIKFWVGIGNKMLANELLPLNVTEKELDDYRSKGYELWQVPIGYLDTFQQNLDEAICSIIGIATASSLKYISGVKVKQAKTDQYLNPFVKDIITVGNNPDDHLQYANFFDLKRVSEDDISKPLFIHLDMSMTGDKTGIAGVWITGKELNSGPKLLPDSTGNTAAALEDIEGNLNMDLHYKLAFSVSIQAPKGAQVSFSKNRNFIRWLRDQGFAIKGISSDTFQSANLQQELKSDGFTTKIISVDRVTKDANGRPVCLPYYYLKSAIYERRITIYDKCDLLTDELIGLERKSDGHVDHTKEGINSKDQADAVCGATWLASQYSEEYSYSYGDNLSATLNANNESNDYIDRQKIATDFENVLLQGKTNLENTDKNFENFQDLSDGIIII